MATFHENLVQSFKNFKSKYLGNIGSSTVANLLNGKADKSAAISNITRPSGSTTFTATRADGTTFTFTQQDTNTTTGTTYNAGSCPDNTTFGTNGSIKKAFDALNSWRPYVPRVNGDWRNPTVGYMSWYFYEGATSYGTPWPHMVIISCKSASNRGGAIGWSWDNGNIGKVWVNGYHDGWKGWVQIH